MYTELSLLNCHETRSSFHSLYFQVLVQIIFFVLGLSRVLLIKEMTAEYSLNNKIWGNNFGVDKNVSYLG